MLFNFPPYASWRRMNRFKVDQIILELDLIFSLVLEIFIASMENSGKGLSWALITFLVIQFEFSSLAIITMKTKSRYIFLSLW